MDAGKEAIPTTGFSRWLGDFRRAQRTGEGMEVPCGDCRGCCTSAYFIPIGRDETEALARIPKALLFPAPGRKGFWLLGYDERGHCALFRDNQCSIYAHRPRTCRSYDCRVFAATGLGEGEDKPAIVARSESWVFGMEGEEDEANLAAVRAAARFLRDHAAAFPEGFVPAQPSQQAVMALRVYPVFLRPSGDVDQTVQAVMTACGSEAE